MENILKSDLTATTKLVLIWLRERQHNGESNKVAQTTISAALGLTLTTVNKAINSLREEGYILVNKSARKCESDDYIVMV